MSGILIHKVLTAVSCPGVDRSLFKCRMLPIVGVDFTLVSESVKLKKIFRWEFRFVIEMIYMHATSLVCSLRNITLPSDSKNKKQ